MFRWENFTLNTSKETVYKEAAVSASIVSRIGQNAKAYARWAMFARFTVSIPYDQTPTVTSDGLPREIDNFQPRAQMRKRFEEGTIVLDDAVCVDILQHICCGRRPGTKIPQTSWLLVPKKKKCTEERRKKKQDDANKTYQGYDWVELFHKGTLSKLIVQVLDLFPEKQSLAHHFYLK